MSLYECSGCTESIRPDKARIQCHICTDYNLCANCFVIQNISQTHQSSHPTAIFKTSGTTTPAIPPPFPPRPVPLLPPRKDTLTTPPKKVDLPTANWGALWDIVKPSRKASKGSSGSQKGSASGAGLGDLISIQLPVNEDAFTAGPLCDNNNLSYSNSPITKLRPDLPIRPVKIELEAFTNPYASMAPPVPSEWGPFFQKDGTANGIFVDLMTTIFLCLDVEETNELRPEVWSAFLEMQGVEMENNIWQKTLYTTGGPQNQEIADLELGIFFKCNEISHTLSVRHASNLPPPSPSPTAGERIRRSISLGANMPMLSRQGFIDVMGMEMLRDPDEGHKRLSGVVSDYAIWKELGAVPRSCFLERKVEKGGRGKRKSLLEMSEEKEEVERRIMEGMLRGVGEGKERERGKEGEKKEKEKEKLGNMNTSNKNTNPDLGKKELNDSKANISPPENFALHSSDEDETFTEGLRIHMEEVDLVGEELDLDLDVDVDLNVDLNVDLGVKEVVDAKVKGKGNGDVKVDR
ncbi:hypothetical protein sscle_11g081810 [Sclerotinia sclerotiorum 1980 UF-70]|uniref:ZZ-type domain-containing protein n=1 Tax=Sclerotinia sclerotiorum (strain ATCC 18683 / 1980 / Ss-1) TaxID=665079 RepID=A0A1D9QET3_SCLS1|nr:hypothetical protein sscle_11g081810 [Sclerotinia sclerotiorum 1980 UF-70]